MSVIFRYPLTILEKHLDSFGHVNNATYLNLYEEARWEFITERGFGLNRVLADQIGPVLLDLNLVFKKELTNREKVVITSQYTGLKNKLVMSMSQIIYNADEKIVSNMDFTMGLMDLRERKLIKPTADWLKAIGAD